ncbi:hypothetical protein [Clostridium baratii]|uniref:hypothetical protein n=1 Tax=Clostridium baratii TaxID=1561 RepID=UPI0030CD9824
MKTKIFNIVNSILVLILLITTFFSVSKVYKLENKIVELEKRQVEISDEMKVAAKSIEENKKVVITKEDKVSVKVNENFEKDGLKYNVRNVEVNKEQNKGYRVIVTLDIENLEDDKEINVGNLIKITDKNNNRVEDTISFDSNLKTLTKNEDIQVKRDYISQTKEINIVVAGVTINL